MDNLNLSTNLAAIVEKMRGFASATLAQGEELMPLWHAQTTNGDPDMVVGTPWANTEEKYLSVRKVQEIFRAKGVVRYAFVTEVWAKSGELTASEIAQVAAQGVSSFSDKTEAVLITAVECGSMPVSFMYPIIRAEDGTATLGEALPTPDFMEYNLLVDIEPESRKH
jgi:hypothetical protein